MFSQIEKVLILSPHPDDAEFGVGGTISKLRELGKDIHIIIFSNCIASTPKGFEPGIIEKELFESCKFMGIPEENIYLLDFKTRYFPSLRQDILEQLIIFRNKINPDLVFLPSSSDIHQDHLTIHNEGIRTFKHCNLLGYEMPWNNFSFSSFVFVALSSTDLQKKIDTLAIYKSQNNRNYSDAKSVTSLAVMRGVQIKQDYAESFELIRFIHY